MFIISKCLLGENCKYDGGNNRNEKVIEFCKEHSYIAVCPEAAGKLPCPRPPAERLGEKVIDKEGKDVTHNFQEGAYRCFLECLQKAVRRGERLDGAILKANSPSCGYREIYDGTFTGTLVEGNGVFAQIVENDNIEIITEKENIKW